MRKFSGSASDRTELPAARPLRLPPLLSAFPITLGIDERVPDRHDQEHRHQQPDPERDHPLAASFTTSTVTLPASITPGSSKQISVFYTPSQAISETGAIDFTFNEVPDVGIRSAAMASHRVRWRFQLFRLCRRQPKVLLIRRLGASGEPVRLRGMLPEARPCLRD